MTTKTVNCVELKNTLQKKLYNSMNPHNTKDYIKKLKDSIDSSKWINEIKKRATSAEKKQYQYKSQLHKSKLF